MNSEYLKLFILLTIGVSAAVAATSVTPSEPCPGESGLEDLEDLRQRITVSPCGKKLCKLVKNTNTTVIFKFKPKTKINTLRNKVYATIAGLPLPFIGVDNQDACPFVRRVSGEAAPCPLEAGVEYEYTNVFPILPLYPAVPLRVHWSLDQGEDSVICFEVDATIVNKK